MFSQNNYFVYSELLYYTTEICYHWVVTVIGHTKKNIQLLLNN